MLHSENLRVRCQLKQAAERGSLSKVSIRTRAHTIRQFGAGRRISAVEHLQSDRRPRTIHRVNES